MAMARISPPFGVRNSLLRPRMQLCHSLTTPRPEHHVAPIRLTPSNVLPTRRVHYPPNRSPSSSQRRTMATTLDRNDLSSPLAYTPEQTALLLLDFQGFTIGLCHEGEKVTARAAELRKWALSKGILVMHSIIDINGTPPPATKGASRLVGMIASIKDNKDAVSEHPSLAYDKQSREFLSLKTPGIVSGMKADDCQKVFKDNNIKSVIICGLSTSGAVLRTAIPATDDGYAVTVIEDACADRTTELHDVLMRDVLPSRGHVCTTAELMKMWDGGN